ncbi:GNAT family N-acetyltransferase [Caproiciproducens sp. NJN-50]|uniref:GNAT family N-acetyltransferase n=1 Tax=Acutalibacteraceae TaxID=3082771 RepID=UPI000FFE1EE5|nr:MULTISPECIES: GNAT family N-acetyltransferase [Acutalibacteraceae]QAT50603.1 GNAT family N-acetyltransferase [Caproiciproducens sp. NJN-50]
MKLDLKHPSLEQRNEYLSFAKDWADHEEEITPYSARLLGRSYEEWLAGTLRMEREAPERFVCAHTFFLTDEAGKILGAVNIRHELNGELLKSGGHIGYGIRPSERRKGYAVRMLALALPIAEQLGIARALITCDKENIASARTILRNGGVLENELALDGRTVQRYWIGPRQSQCGAF